MKFGKNELGTVLTLVFLFLAGDRLFGQAPLTVQPLQPIKPEVRSNQAPNSSYSATPSGSINLESIPQIDQLKPAGLQPAKGTIGVLPLAPAKDDQPRVRGKLSVDEMIRNPSNQFTLFSRLGVQGNFIENATLATPVRGQAAADMNSFEWSPSGYLWQSPAFCHLPLYFEQPNLERYGNHKGHVIAPVVSASYFFAQTLTLPARALWQPPWSKSCTLGNNRPGDCAPIQRRPVAHPDSNQPVVVKISE